MITNPRDDVFTDEDLPKPGETIAGSYVVRGTIGVGGMGAVLEVENEELGGRCALKIMLPSLTDDAEFKARFEREARLSQQVESEHVVRVLDVGALPDGRLFMAMELLEGRDLAGEIEERGALPVEEAVGIIVQAIDALHEAHKQGIIHRDLKPANLFLARRPSGERIVKVLDFGISKKLGTLHKGDGPSLTATDSLLGSPKYMSPEQIRNAKSVDGRADIFSLGVILYKLLLERHPYGGDSLGEYITVLNFEPAAPIEPGERSIPDALATAVMRCLEKKPEGRYRTVARLAADLAPFAPPNVAHVLERLRRDEPSAFPDASSFATGPNKTTAMPGRSSRPTERSGVGRAISAPEATIAETRSADATVTDAPGSSPTVSDASGASDLRSALAGIRVSATPSPRVSSPTEARSRAWLVVGVVFLVAGGVIAYVLATR